MTKAVAMTPLLYGADFLASAIRSVIDSVSEHWVIYSPVGSHGSHTDIPCPETEEQLFNIASEAAGRKLHWYRGHFAHEGIQRDMIFQLAPDADVILALDSDELWPDGLAHACITALDRYPDIPYRLRLPMVHFFRSFYRAVLHDPAFPERVIFPKQPDKRIVLFDDPAVRPIAHMGYSQRSEIVEWKLKVHGHKAQFRTDLNWFRDVWQTNRQYDCHPVGSEFWQPEQVNPWDYLPDFMKSHPYANLEIIP